MQNIYLDHSATTPVHPQVFAKMKPYLQEQFGNPSSIHSFGQSVKVAVENAREQIAKAIHAKTKEIIFTSGGTEADYLAIVGTALANQGKGKHIIVSQIEHSAVIEAAKWLEQLGFEVTYLPVNADGIVDLKALKASLRNDTILVSVMYVNNEIGTIQPINEIGTMLKEKGIFFHTDAVQAFPIISIDLNRLPIDLLTISSHKINGPKGAGALYIREGVPIKPILAGSQERKKRGGTENVPGIVGFGEAAALLKEKLPVKRESFITFKTKMTDIWRDLIGEASFVILGHPNQVVPSILNVSFPGIHTQTMIMKLDMKGIAVSGGAACSSNIVDVSRVIRAMSIPEEIAKTSIRISFGISNTEQEIEYAATTIAEVVNRFHLSHSM